MLETNEVRLLELEEQVANLRRKLRVLSVRAYFAWLALPLAAGMAIWASPVYTQARSETSAPHIRADEIDVNTLRADVIKASRCIISDNTDSSVSLSCTEHGGQVSVRDKRGQKVAEIDCTEIGGRFEIIEPESLKYLALLGAGKQGGRLSILDKQGRGVAYIESNNIGGRFEIVEPESRKYLALLGAGQSGSVTYGYLETYDESGAGLCEVGRSTGGSGYIAVKRNGYVLAQMTRSSSYPSAGAIGVFHSGDQIVEIGPSLENGHGGVWTY